MPLPYYVSPEQMMKDKAEYARKGISRGRSLVTLEYGDGIRTPRTFGAPTASAAMAAVSAESIPPERPSTTRVKPHLRT